MRSASRSAHLDDLTAGIGDNPDQAGNFSSTRTLALTLKGEEINRDLGVFLRLGAISSRLFAHPRFFSIHFRKLLINNLGDLHDQLGVHGFVVFPG